MAFNIESSTLTFASTDSATYTFSQKYDVVPIVTLIVSGSTSKDATGQYNHGNVNAFVDSISATQAVIKLSDSGNFTVHIQVIDRII